MGQSFEGRINKAADDSDWEVDHDSGFPRTKIHRGAVIEIRTFGPFPDLESLIDRNKGTFKRVTITVHDD
jgi:hypothetical protein